MKKLVVLLFVISLSASAQRIKVNSGSQGFSSGNHSAFQVTIYENELDDVKHDWKRELKHKKHEKVKSKGKEIFGDNIVIKEWGNNPVDIYTKFKEDKDKKEVTMWVAVDLGGKYLQSGDGAKYKYMEKWMNKFAIKMTKEAVKKHLKKEDKKLDKLEDQQKDLEKDKKDLEEDIEDYKKKIKKAEDDIKKNEDEQKKKKEEIEAQKKVRDEVKKRLDSVK